MFFKKAKAFDIRKFIEASVEGMELAMTTHCKMWHLDKAESWSVDQEAGFIVFYLPDGIVATAPVQIIGTSNSDDNSFLWSWDHPSIIPQLAGHAKLVKAFGEEHGISEYVTSKVACNDRKAWEFLALAMRLGKANGTYSAKASPTACVWMTFGAITLKNSST